MNQDQRIAELDERLSAKGIDTSLPWLPPLSQFDLFKGSGNGGSAAAHVALEPGSATNGSHVPEGLRPVSEQGCLI